jgi:Ni,Fe-hydrogenase I cytochrome b subunit
MNQSATLKDDVSSLFGQKNPTAIRVWHWLTFLFVISLIVTVLMAATALNPRSNVPEIQTILKGKGIVVDNSQAFAVAHMFDDKMWNLHKLLGYALAILFLARVFIELRQPLEERNKSRIRKALFTYLGSKNEADKKELRHYLIVKYSYILFYGLLLVMVVTGLIIAFGGDLGISGQNRHLIKEIHGFVQYFIYLFVVAHLVGVVLADLGKYKGIISGMINDGMTHTSK